MKICQILHIDLTHNGICIVVLCCVPLTKVETGIRFIQAIGFGNYDTRLCYGYY